MNMACLEHDFDERLAHPVIIRKPLRVHRSRQLHSQKCIHMDLLIRAPDNYTANYIQNK